MLSIRSYDESQLYTDKDVSPATSTDTKYFISQDSARKTQTLYVYQTRKDLMQGVRYLKIVGVDGRIKTKGRCFYLSEN